MRIPSVSWNAPGLIVVFAGRGMTVNRVLRRRIRHIAAGGKRRQTSECKAA
jgi:hypothetical protein